MASKAPDRLSWSDINKYKIGGLTKYIISNTANVYNHNLFLLSYEKIPASKTQLVIPYISENPLYLSSQMIYGETVDIICKLNDWSLIITEFFVGWINNSHLSVNKPIPVPQIPQYIPPNVCIREIICQTARIYLGTPYLWGGRSLNGIDCSALCQFAYDAVGLKIPRFSQGQYNFSRQVSFKELDIGDLIFIEDIIAKRIVHVVILSDLVMYNIIEACGLTTYNTTHEIKFFDRYHYDLSKLDNGSYLGNRRRIYFGTFINNI